MLDEGMSIKSSIAGVNITLLSQIFDERGGVLHMMRSDAPEFVGFGECYFSEIFPGAIKAWKLHLKQTQNLAVPIGRIRLVIFDNRCSSSTRGTILSIELGRPDAYFRVQIPPGLLYGFCTIGPTSALIVNCTDLPHEKGESELRGLNDPEIPYTWLSL
jgi:dTDP-4-dehydrorhamnose 3,5-epimerase